MDRLKRGKQTRRSRNSRKPPPVLSQSGAMTQSRSLELDDDVTLHTGSGFFWWHTFYFTWSLWKRTFLVWNIQPGQRSTDSRRGQDVINGGSVYDSTSLLDESSSLFNCEYKQSDTWLILLHFFFLRQYLLRIKVWDCFESANGWKSNLSALPLLLVTNESKPEWKNKDNSV